MTFRCTPANWQVIGTSAAVIGAAGAPAVGGIVIHGKPGIGHPKWVYVSDGEPIVFGQGEVTLDVASLFDFDFVELPEPIVGTSVIETLTGQADLAVGLAGAPSESLTSDFSLSVQAFVRRAGPDVNEMSMDMDLMDLDFAGLPTGVLLREAVSIPSSGAMSIVLQADGSYAVDSFFDIWTEVSLDGGQSWLAAHGSLGMTLVPTPAAGSLMGLGLMVATTRRRRAR